MIAKQKEPNEKIRKWIKSDWIWTFETVNSYASTPRFREKYKI